MSLAGISTALGADMFASMSPTAYAKKAKAQDTSTGTTTGSTSTMGTAAEDSSSIGTTFLNLLVQELQNQDPTAPVDSTAMVGQMISLNQLDQLVSINGELGAATGAAASSTGSSSSAGSSSNANALTGGPAAAASTTGASAAHAQLANAMNLAAANASDPTKPLNLASLSSIYGGK